MQVGEFKLVAVFAFTQMYKLSNTWCSTACNLRALAKFESGESVGSNGSSCSFFLLPEIINLNKVVKKLFRYGISD